MKNAPGPDQTPFMYRVGVTEGLSFGGMDRLSDPGGIAPNRFHLLLNARHEGSITARNVRCRGGQTKLNTSAIFGTPKGIFEMGILSGQDADPSQLTAYSIQGTDGVSFTVLNDALTLPIAGSNLPHLDSSTSRREQAVVLNTGETILLSADQNASGTMRLTLFSLSVLKKPSGGDSFVTGVAIAQVDLGAWVTGTTQDALSFVQSAIAFRDGIVFAVSTFPIEIWWWRPSAGFSRVFTSPSWPSPVTLGLGPSAPYTSFSSGVNRVILAANTEGVLAIFTNRLVVQSPFSSLNGIPKILSTNRAKFSFDPLTTWTDVALPTGTIDRFRAESAAFFGGKFWIGGAGITSGYVLKSFGAGNGVDNLNSGHVLLSWDPQSPTATALLAEYFKLWPDTAADPENTTFPDSGYGVRTLLPLQFQGLAPLLYEFYELPSTGPPLQPAPARFQVAKWDGATRTVLATVDATAVGGGSNNKPAFMAFANGRLYGFLMDYILGGVAAAAFSNQEVPGTWNAPVSASGQTPSGRDSQDSGQGGYCLPAPCVQLA